MQGYGHLEIVLSIIKKHPRKIISSLILGLFLYLKWKYDRRYKIYHHESPLNNFLVSRIHQKMETYSPTFWLPISLIKSAFLGKSLTPYLRDYLRWEYRFKDGSLVGLDVHPRSLAKDSKVPTVLIVPGIFTESGDHQVIYIVKYLWEKYGFRSVVFNRIGFSGVKIEGESVCSYDCYDDFHDIVSAVKSRFHGAPLYLFGASLGAAFIQRYLEEFSGKTIVDAAACISSPWNTALAAKNFHDNPAIRVVILYV